MWCTFLTPLIFNKCSFISSTFIPLGVFSKNKSIITFKFFKAFININRATNIDNIGSIIFISVNRIIIAPIKTTIHPRTSSSICKLTDF